MIEPKKPSRKREGFLRFGVPPEAARMRLRRAAPRASGKHRRQ